ncbi:BlaI/MecI/CopY family transcriptional regulator [Schnuerera sp.]|uniref:BlaI/MecI/CopY family transcriptional regulator n=1 Tax=Schnuerera sp. TaxID=2794844 RepID=UPI002D00D742|nr:BlaI/MecI/CopY family transcriptional regulator [Schnuerera sp.]HSH35408.1 BlaI/MecI/CopY family transcriptional regulator [Schnuerera sp.]
MKKLGEAEFEIMQVIWSANRPLKANSILEELKEKRKWALSTLMSSLSRLEKKGFINIDRTKRYNLYTAVVSEEDYKSKESRTFLKKIYNNSLPSLVVNLYNSKAIDDEDLSELKELIEKIGKDESND